jgi:hypothetical protein
MLTADLLIAIAQIAVALAGFSGLIAAIRTAAPDGWHPRDIWSLSWMLGASIGALILALLPLSGGPKISYTGLPVPLRLSTSARSCALWPGQATA